MELVQALVLVMLNLQVLLPDSRDGSYMSHVFRRVHTV